eukprot:TRINITY_DN4816_c0_g1_i1.p1 TRINITY_DN4816_c0_g1~~TRINITY_DN4816_c0_g1_i1.p1  ORF type:complete len:262 (-),score=20.34 TRINITY_DN4816_c0_g1_i1:27-812(-)
MQVQSQKMVSGRRYRSFFQSGSLILREEGISGLLRGLTPSMLREASYSSLRLGLYSPTKNLCISSTGSDKDSFLVKITAGLVSGAIGSSIANPTDLIKIRFQTRLPEQPKPYKNTLHAFIHIYKYEGGIQGLYRGVVPTCLRASILTSAQLASYDHSKYLLREYRILEDGPHMHIIAAIISGLVTTTASSPVDVIKTRIMNTKGKGIYKGPIDCFIKSVKTGGIRVLWRGWVPNYLRLGPHFVLSLPLFEQLRRLFGADYL